MAVSYSREELGRGISLTRIYDKKFKSNCVKIAFISPLDEKTACVNAMLQTVLVTSNAEIPSRTKLTSTLTGLYGSSIGTNCGTIGDYQSVGLSASFIGDDYTIDGEVISVQVVRQLLNCLLRPHLVDGKFCEKYFTLRKQELIDALLPLSMTSVAMHFCRRKRSYLRASLRLCLQLELWSLLRT